MSTPESAAALTQHHPAVTRNLERISKRSKPAPLSILPSSPDYPTHYNRLANRIRTALGDDGLLFIQHTGSTSIPGMPAKPIIDIDVVVADPTDEAAYVNALVGEGWETTGTGKGTGKGEQQTQTQTQKQGGKEKGAGLQFMLREPGWHEHRFFVYDESEPVANVHVFGPGCPEVVRHQIFREWLLAHPEDFEKYAATKREASQASLQAGETMDQYNSRKEPVIRDILDRAFKAQGLLQ